MEQNPKRVARSAKLEMREFIGDVDRKTRPERRNRGIITNSRVAAGSKYGSKQLQRSIKVLRKNASFERADRLARFRKSAQSVRIGNVHRIGRPGGLEQIAQHAANLKLVNERLVEPDDVAQRVVLVVVRIRFRRSQRPAQVRFLFDDLAIVEKQFPCDIGVGLCVQRAVPGGKRNRAIGVVRVIFACGVIDRVYQHGVRCDLARGIKGKKIGLLERCTVVIPDLGDDVARIRKHARSAIGGRKIDDFISVVIEICGQVVACVIGLDDFGKQRRGLRRSGIVRCSVRAAVARNHGDGQQ